MVKRWLSSPRRPGVMIHDDYSGEYVVYNEHVAAVEKVEEERDEARSQRDTLDNILCSIVSLLGNHITRTPKEETNGGN